MVVFGEVGHVLEKRMYLMFEQVVEACSTTIVNRAKEYASSRNIDRIEIKKYIVKGHKICEVVANVTGSSVYTTAIIFYDGEFDEYDCSCPYAESGNYCKHLAALALYCYKLRLAGHSRYDFDGDTYGAEDLNTISNVEDNVDSIKTANNFHLMTKDEIDKYIRSKLEPKYADLVVQASNIPITKPAVKPIVAALSHPLVAN